MSIRKVHKVNIENFHKESLSVIQFDISLIVGNEEFQLIAESLVPEFMKLVIQDIKLNNDGVYFISKLKIK